MEALSFVLILLGCLVLSGFFIQARTWIKWLSFIFILPWAMPNYITALIWKGMFHQQFGVINQIIQMLGGTPVSWFEKYHLRTLAVVDEHETLMGIINVEDVFTRLSRRR